MRLVLIPFDADKHRVFVLRVVQVAAPHSAVKSPFQKRRCTNDLNKADSHSQGEGKCNSIESEIIVLKY